MLWYHSQINIHPPIETLVRIREAAAPDLHLHLVPMTVLTPVLIQTAILVVVILPEVVVAVVAGQAFSKAS